MGLSRMTDDVGRLKDLLLLLISIVLYTVERERVMRRCVCILFKEAPRYFPPATI